MPQPRTLNQAIYDALDDYRTQAVALLGPAACVGFDATMLPNGDMQVRFTVSLHHGDGYKLQEFGSGITFFEALKNATEHSSIPTTRWHKDRERRERQIRNKKAEQSNQVRAEAAKVERDGL